MAYKSLTGQDVRGKGDEEIAEELKQLRERLYTLRVQSVTEKVEDNSQFIKIRRDIARLLTEQNARRRAKAAESMSTGGGRPRASRHRGSNENRVGLRIGIGVGEPGRTRRRAAGIGRANGQPRREAWHEQRDRVTG